MAGRVCRTCGLSYGNSPDFDPCPICGVATEYSASAIPDADIEVAVAAALHVSASQRRILMHRRRTFVRLGFAGAMLDMLAESDVDLHQAQQLREQGCPLDLVAQILI
jgi:hypothetical protein